MDKWQAAYWIRCNPVVLIDAIHVKIRDGQVANRPIYVVVAVSCWSTRAWAEFTPFLFYDNAI
ncbi:hypothetical protein ACTXG5_27320 [Mycobacterium sp. Dal123C01]|uniref:hypothetical protein n=1 Tax=Mycobacterium sp. Dal123C01 TaxID=3457577 RepID=UPI00403E657F